MNETRMNETKVSLRANALERPRLFEMFAVNLNNPPAISSREKCRRGLFRRLLPQVKSLFRYPLRRASAGSRLRLLARYLPALTIK
jgi:hypothetical protein